MIRSMDHDETAVVTPDWLFNEILLGDGNQFVLEMFTAQHT